MHAGIAMHDRQDHRVTPAARRRAPPARCRLRPSRRSSGSGCAGRSPH